MDPNTCLDAIRRIVDKIGTSTDSAADREDLLIHFEALDKWLSHGGFLPKRWERPKATKNFRVDI